MGQDFTALSPIIEVFVKLFEYSSSFENILMIAQSSPQGICEFMYVLSNYSLILCTCIEFYLLAHPNTFIVFIMFGQKLTDYKRI